jgi:hypothetical protein
MFKRLLFLVFSISPMMLVGCGTPRLESQAPLTIEPDDDCIWTDTPEDVLAGYEWTGIVTGDFEARPDDLYLHCYTGSHHP